MRYGLILPGYAIGYAGAALMGATITIELYHSVYALLIGAAVTLCGGVMVFLGYQDDDEEDYP